MKDLPILEFQGAYRFLSNMWDTPVTILGRTFSSSEAAYQSSKTLDPIVRDSFTLLGGIDSKKAGRELVLRSDWSIVKLEVMELCVRSKFMNPGMSKLLKGTGNSPLVEGNTWGDTFWGRCNGLGQNHLGRLLMSVRKDLLG